MSCMPLFITKVEDNPVFTNKQMDKMWYVCTMERYLVVQRNGVLIHVTAMNFQVGDDGRFHYMRLLAMSLLERKCPFKFLASFFKTIIFLIICVCLCRCVFICLQVYLCACVVCVQTWCACGK